MIDSYAYLEKPGPAGGTLVFAFHGTGGNERQFAGLVEDVLPGAHLVAPRGDVSEHGALRFFRRTGEGIYDMADLAARTRAMTGFIAAHRDRVKPSRVVALGYSNGANILASVLFNSVRLIDQAVLMHPLIPFEPPPNPVLASVGVLITAGRNDPICPAPLTTRLADYFRTQSATVAESWHDGGHELRPTEVEALRAFLSA